MGFFEVFAAALAGFYALIESYGFAIILLTVAVRIVLLPLSIKQTRSMREMQRIQPELKKLQQKHKGDRQKMNEEMMALYKEHGVNPFGGCLPLLMQFPVLIALFYVIREPLNYLGFHKPRGVSGAIPPREYIESDVTGIMQTLQESTLVKDLLAKALEINQFLGLRLDCSTSAALGSDDPSRLGEACGSGIVSALPYLVLVLLMGFTTWYQQKQMQAKQTGGSDMQAQQMQMMARVMPVMLMVFAYSFPTGVVLYWLTTNVWTIGQQRLMFRVAPPVTPGSSKQLEPAYGNGNPPATTESKPNPSASKKKKKKKR